MNLKDLIKQQLEKSKQFEKQVEEIEEEIDTVSITARTCLVAPKDYVFVSMDYKSQEVYIGAVLSQDKRMLKPFLPETEEYKEVKDEKGEVIKYPNPETDLHLQTAVYVCYPELFKGEPEHKWLTIAKQLLPGTTIQPRKIAKIVNFSMQYLITAQALADRNNMPVEICEKWIKDYKRTYERYIYWAEKEIGDSAKVLGWTATADARCRWCQEGNSKGDESGTVRMAVNHQI